MKAQWDYRGTHAEERLQRENGTMSVTGKLVAAAVLLIIVSFAIFAPIDIYNAHCPAFETVMPGSLPVCG